MPKRLHLTLEGMCQAALGTPKLTDAHIGLLRSFINILINKLQLKDEVVTFSGEAAEAIRALANEAYAPVLCLDDRKVTDISEQDNRIGELRDRMDSLKTIFEAHIDDIKRAQLKQPTSDPDKWDEEYAAAAEDLCSSSDPDLRVSCELLCNSHFVNKILNCFSEPIERAISNIEKRIDALDRQLDEIIAQVEKGARNIEIMRNIKIELAKLKERYEAYLQVFIISMADVKNMLDTKLEKRDIPAMKKYIETRVEFIVNQIDEMIAADAKCPTLRKDENRDGMCVACGAKKKVEFEMPHSFQEKLFETKEEKRAKKKIKQQSPLAPKLCSCEGREDFLLEQELKKLAKRNKFCKLGLESAEKPVKYLEGTDGKLYRKGSGCVLKDDNLQLQTTGNGEQATPSEKTLQSEQIWLNEEALLSEQSEAKK